MAHEIHYLAKYGTLTSFPFFAPAILTSGTRQQFVSGAGGPVTADVTISKDGAALAAPAGTVTQVGTKLYLLNLTAADLQAQRLLVLISDAAGAAYDDVQITIETRLDVGSVSVDPRQLGGNVNGVESFGQGSGSAFFGTAGATGQICNFFKTVLGAEPAGAWNALTSTVEDFIQHLAARFYHRVVTSGTQQSVYKRDNTTVLDQMTITPSGSTVEKGRA